MDLKKYFDVFDADGNNINDCEVKIKDGCDIFKLTGSILFCSKDTVVWRYMLLAETRTKEDMEMDEKIDDTPWEGACVNI